MKNTKIVFILVVSLLASMLLFYNVHADGPTYDVCTLPDNSDPMGIIYDSARNLVWVALSGFFHMYTYNGSLAKIDLNNNNSVTIYELPYNLGNHEEPYTPQNDFRRPVPNYLALDGDGNIWIACDYNWHPMLGITESPIIKFIVANETFDVIWVQNRGHCAFDVVFDGKYIWLELNQMCAIDYVTNEVVYQGIWLGTRMKVEGDIIWTQAGKFNTTDHTLQGINGTIESPFGIAYDKNYVYYAEWIEVHGSIVQVNKTDMTIVQRITPTPAWTTDVCVDKDGNIWWAAESGYMGVINQQVGISGINFTYPARAFVSMTEVPSHSIWFSYTDGSTGGGAKYLSYIESGAVAGVGHIGLSKIRIDVNKDKVVNMKDIGLVARQFGTNENSTNWIPLTDICEPLDGKVDMKDVSMVARHFGETVE